MKQYSGFLSNEVKETLKSNYWEADGIFGTKIEYLFKNIQFLK